MMVSSLSLEGVDVFTLWLNSLLVPDGFWGAKRVKQGWQFRECLDVIHEQLLAQ